MQGMLGAVELAEIAKGTVELAEFSRGLGPIVLADLSRVGLVPMGWLI